MIPVTIAKTANEIALYAVNRPKAPGETGRQVNVLSPHFERLTTELVRRVLIQRTQAAKAEIAKEIIQLRALLPEGSQAQLDLTAAKINQSLHNIYS